jgi:hypothetical protein
MQDQRRDYKDEMGIRKYQGKEGGVPNEMVTRRMTQVTTILRINIEEESYKSIPSPRKKGDKQAWPGTTITFSSKQASKNANPVWIPSGKCDTTHQPVSSRNEKYN